MSPPEPRPKPHWTLGAIAMFGFGLLILVPSGLCTAIVGAMSFSDVVAGEFLSSVLILALFGGIPMALGLALVIAGWRRSRRN